VEVREVDARTFTYVFPQNCSALLRFTVQGGAGATVRFKPCEYMEESGRVRFTYTWGTGKDIWQDYTLRGEGPESHQTLFCYAGAQYVQVEGAVPQGRANPEGLPVVRSLELVHVRADCDEVGRFECDSELQNGAHRIIDWSIRSNMSHFPTDCPHREKNCWLEQDWHMARALSYRYDVRDWFGVLCGHIRDTQLPDGHVPTNSPNYLVGVPPHGFWNEAPEWGIAAVLVPWHLYEWYGDARALEESFESARRYVDYLAGQAKDGIITSNLGDWYDYGHGKGNGPSRWTPNEVSATAIWALGARTLAQMAAVLGKEEEERRYRAMYERVRGDFLRHFYDAAAKTVKNNGSCQAAHSVALCAGLIPEEDRGAVLGAIAADLEQRGYQQTVGEVLQVFFVRALAEGGGGDVLHRVYAREERGGYGYMVKSGLTTLPESWSAEPGTGDSMNHFMLGHLVEWHFAYVAGIRQQEGSVGWRKVMIAPAPGELRSARAEFDSPAGRIVSAWEVSDGRFRLRAVVPRGSEARVVLPDGTEREIGAGEHEMECAWGG
jgi:alpha-L-rhamnosidase